MNKCLSFILKLAPAAALLSCATTMTDVTSSWKLPGYTGRIQNVLVVGVTKNQSGRRQFEDYFVEQLRKRKVTAIPSYSIFPEDKISGKEAVAATVKEKGIDTILITRVTDKKDVQSYVPGSGGPYGTYWGYYGYSWNSAYSPGYTIQNTVAVLETNLYSVADEQLEWTATSNTTTEGDNTDVIKSFIPAIVTKMEKDKLL